MITVADMYFSDQRLAVFCDSTAHHRGAKAILKDARVSERLAQIGIRTVRVPGALIVRDLAAAADMVTQALLRGA
jgi:very-short-patch-repair endonuclease